MKKFWKRWISGLVAAALVTTNIPVQTFAQTETDESGKPTSIRTSEGGEVQVEESWEEAYPYGAFLFSNSDAALTEGGEEISIPIYRLGGNSGRATAYVVYAPVVMQLTEEITAYASAAGSDDVEIAVEDALPIAAYQPLGKDPDPEPSEVRILEKAAVGDEAQPDDRVLYLSESAEGCRWQVLSDGRWETVEDATDAELVLSEEFLKEYDFRCVFTKDGQSFCTYSLKGEAYVRPEEEVLPDMPGDLNLNPEKTFTQVEKDAENPYAAKIFQVTFADGEWVKEIRVKATENDKAQPLRFGTFTILDHYGGEIFTSASTVSMRLTDNDILDEPYTIGFEEMEITADKSEGTAVLKLRREGGGQELVTVDYKTVDGTAEAGKDYESVSGTAVFYADINEVTINVPLLLGGAGDGEPLSFSLALGEVKGDANGLCTLTEQEAVVHLTNVTAAQDSQKPADASEEGEASGDDLTNEAVAGTPKEAAALPENALPYGGIADAFRQGSGASGAEPLTGRQVVTSEEELLHGKISGYEGIRSGGGPFRSFNYGQITFNQAHGGNYWDDKVYIAGQSPNALTGWKGGEADGSGWIIKSDDNAQANLAISNMSTLYSNFYGKFEFNARLDNGWHFTNGWAYGWAGLTKEGGDGWYQTVSSDPKFSADGFLNTDRHLNYKTGGTIDTSLDMATKVKAVSLQISKHENKARENVFSKVTKAYLTRRVFNNNLSLRIHTANDGENGDENVATAPDGAAAFEVESGVYNSMKPEILVNEHNGGVNGSGHLYVGSKLQVTLKSTDSYEPYSGDALNSALYVTDQDGKIVPAKIEEGSGKDYYVTMLWDGMKEADLSKSYTLNVVMTRRQQLELDLSPSVERKVDSDGSVTADIDIEKTGDAWDVFWTSGADTITVGYSETTQKAPHFNRDTVSEKQIKKTDCTSEDQNPVKLLGSMDNVQYINFNRGSGDRIVYNGKMYKGNERIYLTVNDLAYEKIRFLYYAERYLTSPSIMNASISRIELYFDGDGDGQIAGSYNKDTGYFVLDSNTKDTFVMYLEGDGTYDEGMFQPMELEDGGVGQYYAKIFYTMTPRSLEGTGGHAQVLPALATSLTNEVNRAQLTREQRTYRYLLAGPDADGKRTSDNHPMYGAEATAFQYVDVPLGGDHSPLRETEPDVYEWNPRYEGNLLYAFSNPEPIYIEHSLAGDNYPLAKVSYGEATGINIDAAGKANLNGYLGSLVADTTIALCIGEQRLTADDLHENPDSEKNLQLESSALCGFSASPDSSWLTQIDSADMGEAGLDTGDSGQEYPEFDQDYNIDIPFESVSFQGLGTICLSKNVISVVFAVPVLSSVKLNSNSFKSNKFPKTFLAPLGNMKKQISGVRQSMQEGSFNSFIEALGNTGYNTAGKIKSRKQSFTLVFTGGFNAVYDTRENHFVIQDFFIGISGSYSFKYNIRLSYCPVVYGFISLSVGATVTTGGVVLHKDTEGELIVSDEGGEIRLKKGEKLSFQTPYVNANIEFSGKVYIETKALNGEKVNNGYLRSDGGKRIQLQFKNSWRDMTFDNEMKKREITITALEDTEIHFLNTVKDTKSDVEWSGVKIAPKITAEIGVGAGVEGLCVESFIKLVLSANIVFGALQDDGSRKTIRVDSANFGLSLAFRAVLFFFSWEVDAIGIKAGYNGRKDEWSLSYTVFNEDYTILSGQRLAGAGEEEEPEPNSHLPKALYKTQDIYSSQPGSEPGAQILRAFSGLAGMLRSYKPDDPDVPFQLSGYNSSSQAFNLADGLDLGCQYKVVSVNGANYVVYTIGRPDGKGMDTTMLALSRLALAGEGYGQNVGQEGEDFGDGLGLVNPLDWEEYEDENGEIHQVVKAPNERSDVPYILVDLKENGLGELADDGTGDIEFDVKAIGDKIHVAWVSYASPDPDPSEDTRAALQKAVRNTVVRQAAYDVTKKEGFTAAETLSDAEGGAGVYLPKIVNEKYTAYIRTNHLGAEERAELVENYSRKLNELGYYKDQGSDAARSIYEYRLALYENILDYKGAGSTLCVYVNSDEGAYANQKLYEFPTMGGSESGYASESPVAPIDMLEVFEDGDASAGEAFCAAYTTWREDVNSEELQNESELYMTSFKDTEEGIVCPYGHVAVSSEELDGHTQNDTLTAYARRTSEPGVPGREVETILFVGQGGSVYMIPSERISAYLKNGSGNILQRTAFSGGDEINRTGFAFGEDGDGNLVAVYVATVKGTTNNGIFLSKFDSENGVWGGGTLLAMRHMDVCEDAAKYGWTDEDAEKAYLGELEGYSDGEGLGRGGMDQFQFSNPQIALGVKGEEQEDSETGEATNLSRSNTTLTILTQGMMRYLVYQEAEGERFLTSGAVPPGDAAFKEGLGVYAISYGVGQQRIGQANLSFLNEDFTAGSALTAALSFSNTGDISIRGSEDNPITVALVVAGEDLPYTKLAVWKVTDNIYPGREVQLNGDFTLPVTLPEDAGFSLVVGEDRTYAEDPYIAAIKDIYTIRKRPELAIEESQITLSGKDSGSLALDENGNVLLDVDLFVTNRGTEDAENVYLQFSYGVHDPDMAMQVKEIAGEGADWNEIIYVPLDISDHDLEVGEEENLLRGSSRGGDELSRGILGLQGIRAGYGRHVRGTLTVPADVFSIFREDRLLSNAGSLMLVVEAFGGSDEVTTNEFGLDVSSHDEYDGLNNRSEARVEHMTAFCVPEHIEVPVGMQLRLPVSFSTTLGSREPKIDATELLDRKMQGSEEAESGKPLERRTDVLTWQPADYQNGRGTGTLIFRGARMGTCYIRIQDRKTNAFRDMSITFTEEAKGLDITNNNGLFTYYDTAGQPFIVGNGDDWIFREPITSWREGEEPLNKTLALGRVGASFRFTTEAEAFALDFDGKIQVTSDFPGFESVTLEDEGKIRGVILGQNPESKPHTVTVTVVEEASPGTADEYAYFDKMIECYAGDLIHQAGGSAVDPAEVSEWKDSLKSTFIWGTNLPKTGSLKAGQVFETTLYGIVNGVLLKNSQNHFTYAADNVEVLSSEVSDFGTYGKKFALKLRFTGNGTATFKLENDKGEAYVYSADVDWWEPRASAFSRSGDAAYSFYEQKYPELPEMFSHTDDVETVDNRWMHAGPDDRGGAVKVRIDDNAPKESYKVWTVEHDEYLENFKLREEDAVVVRRGEAVSIPAEEKSEVWVIARAFSEDGGNPDEEYQIRRADGTLERFNAEDAKYINLDLVEVPEAEELIAFKTQSLVLSGRIGVNFFMNLPPIEGVDYNESYMEFTVCGDKTIEPFNAKERNSAGTYFRFTRHVNSVQMADEIKAVFHYFRDGEERTLEKTYSVKQYVLDFDRTGGFGEKVTALAHALADYGHHVQPYLSQLRGWEIGTDHLEMDLSYKGDYSNTDLTNAQLDLQNNTLISRNARDVKKVSCSLYLDSGTAINLMFTMKDGYEGKVSATVDGVRAQPEDLGNGRFRVSIPDIPAHRLNKEYRVAFKSKGGTTSMNVSVLDYVQKLLKNPKDENLKNCLLALYSYHKAAEALLKIGG